MRRYLVFTLLCVAGQTQAFTSIDGATYAAECNPHGAILRGQSVSPRTIVLGASCDAVAQGLGEGAWGSNRDGFVAKFGEETVAFPGQLYPCGTDADPDPYFGLSCDIPQ